MQFCGDRFVVLQLEDKTEFLLLLESAAGEDFEASMLSKWVKLSTNESLPAF